MFYQQLTDKQLHLFFITENFYIHKRNTKILPLAENINYCVNIFIINEMNFD